MPVLVDTNVIIDILSDDPNWADWSEDILAEYSENGLAINSAVYAELCFGCESTAEVDAITSQMGLQFLEIPKDGLFCAAKAFAKYRNSGGTKNFVLPDFFIGGHAESSSIPLITRDATRYRTYFPDTNVISP
ncbi:MAG: type II toxin-antitoxin system VapC family toxin [Verrucomicrobiales bacterium]|nr:type II toxin-antitoxin system VapC family toxin [Verrucomicrobiales bacterium]